MDFWGGPLWDGIALEDILPLEKVLGNRGENVKSHSPAAGKSILCDLVEKLRQPYKASLVTLYPPKVNA